MYKLYFSLVELHVYSLLVFYCRLYFPTYHWCSIFMRYQYSLSRLASQCLHCTGQYLNMIHFIIRTAEKTKQETRKRKLVQQTCSYA